MEWSQLEAQTLPSLTEITTTAGGGGGGGASLSYDDDDTSYSHYHPGLPNPLPATMTATTTMSGWTTQHPSKASAQVPLPSSPSSSSTFSSASWLELRLAHHERALVQRLVEESSRDSQRLANDVWQRRHVQALWQHDREQWLSHVIGTQYLGGTTGTGTASASASASDGTTTSRRTMETPPLHNNRNRNRNLVRRFGSPLAGSFARSLGGSLPTASTATMTTTTTTTTTTRMDPSMISAHVDIVRSMSRSPPSPHQTRSNSSFPSSSMLVTTMDAFYQLAKSLSSSSSSSSSSFLNHARAFAGYAVAWQWAVPLVHTTWTLPTTTDVPKAGMSTTALNTTTMTKTSSEVENQANMITARARASLLHLCRQYRHVILQHVQAQARDGGGMSGTNRPSQQYSYTTTLAPVILHSYVPSVAVVGQSSSTTTTAVGEQQGQLGLWPMLYYCLRCGDARAAEDIVASTQPSTNIPSAVSRLIQALARVQSSSSDCLWENDVIVLDPNDRQTVADLLVETTTSSQASSSSNNNNNNNQTNNYYEPGVYALLSGASSLPTVEGLSGFSTMEDYLFGALWKALLVAGNPKDSVTELKQLARTIQQLGPDYFGDDEAGGWAYALPLLLTQQYQAALLFLGQRPAASNQSRIPGSASASASASGEGSVGLLQAAHLGLVLSTAGVALTDLVSSSDDDDDGSDNNYNTDLKAKADLFTATLLAAYADLLVTEPSAGPVVALEYLVRIPHKGRAGKEIASLIVQTGQLDQLVGTVDREGMRVEPVQGVALSQFFTPSEISNILATAAERFLEQSSSSSSSVQTKGMAVMCYMLAGRYADLLALLNQFLSPPHEPDADRSFWIEQTRQFHALYLETRTQVAYVLESEHQQSAITTSRIMLDLNAFFAMLSQQQTYDRIDGDWERQLTRLADLLPVSAEDIAVKQRHYQSTLDPLVKEALPMFLVGVVEALSRQHSALKQQQLAALRAASHSRPGSLSSVDAATLTKQLEALQARARLLRTYAGVLGIAKDQTATLARFESMMM